MCSFAEYNLSKVDICTNLQKKHCGGEQIFLVGMELLNNTHRIRQMDFGDLPQNRKYSIQNVLILLISTDQNKTFAPIYRKSTASFWR